MNSKIVIAAAFVGLVPAVAFATGAGMGMYGTASFGGGGGGNATAEDAQEEYAKAVHLMDKQDFEDAIPHLVRTLRVEQGNAELLNDLGYATRMTGDYSTSVDYLQRAISRDPGLGPAYANLGQTYLAMHQPDQARSELAALKKICPGGCDAQDVLTQSITTYDNTNKTAAQGGGSPPPSSPRQ